MLTLSLLEAHWIDSQKPGDDQCAHGTVLLSVAGHELVTPLDGELTVSAAALHLLRTLEHDHIPGSAVSVGGHLFPCCGFNVWVASERFPVVVVGCPSGVDFELIHRSGGVSLRNKGTELFVPDSEWRNAVVSFAESVLAFYQREAPRSPIEVEEDMVGWQAFWQEYGDRLERHRVAV